MGLKWFIMLFLGVVEPDSMGSLNSDLDLKIVNGLKILSSQKRGGSRGV